MQYTVTGRRGGERQSQVAYSAAEGVRIADQMIAAGFIKISIMDRTYREIGLAQLRADALAARE